MAHTTENGKLEQITWYIEQLFQKDLDEFFENARQHLPVGRFDTLVGTGLSGTLAVPLLANYLGTDFVIIRKGETSHSSNVVEGRLGSKWVMVDDVINTGETLRKVREAISNFAHSYNFKTQYIGVYLYESCEFWNQSHRRIS